MCEILNWVGIFRLCVQSVYPMFNVSSLKESQFQALYSFICGEEVFVNENVSAIHWKKNPAIIIISPLLALMHEQSEETIFSWI